MIRIINLKESTGRLVCWLLQLQEFKLDEAHCADVTHQAADALSQVKTDRTYQTSIRGQVAVLCITVSIAYEIREQTVIKMQQYDLFKNIEGAWLFAVDATRH